MAIQWSLVLFTALTGAAGWMFVGLAIDEFKQKAPSARALVALVSLLVAIVGGCLSVTHLSHPENILAALNHPTSGIFVEALLIGIFAVFGIVYLILVKRGAGAGACKAFAIITALVGVVLSFMAGYSYMMSSRPVWNTILLPLGYLGTAAPAGLALYTLVAQLKDKAADLAFYAKAIMIAGIVALCTAVLYFIAGGVLSEALVWVVVVVVFSGLVPVLAGVLAKDSKSIVTWAAAASIAALAGAIAYRCAMWAVSEPIADLFQTIF